MTRPSLMRKLTSLLNLVVITSMSFGAPWLLFTFIVAVFPEFPQSAYIPTYAVLAFSVAFLGGTMLGRSWAWRGRVWLLTGLFWALVMGEVIFVTSRGGEFSVEDTAARLLWAVGISVGLHVGARFMRAFDAVGKT